MGRTPKQASGLTPEKEAELKAKILADKSPRQQVEIKAHWALVDLSHFYEEQGSNLFYKVNRLMHELSSIFTEEKLKQGVGEPVRSKNTADN